MKYVFEMVLNMFKWHIINPEILIIDDWIKDLYFHNATIRFIAVPNAQSP